MSNLARHAAPTAVPRFRGDQQSIAAEPTAAAGARREVPVTAHMTCRCSIGASTPYERKRLPVSITANKRIARRFFADVLTRRNVRAVDELIAPDAVVCMPTGRFTGLKGVKLASVQIASAFPDRRIEIQALVAAGNRVAVEWTLCGTQRRELLGVPPTGRPECISALSLFRIENEKIVDHWMAEDIPALNALQPNTLQG
jgi:predicted ester cyclase